MPFTVRKIAVYKEYLAIEGGRPLPRPILLVGAAAVIVNPWAGQGFVEDLKPLQVDGCAEIGKRLSDAVMAEMQGEAPMEAYGKAAVVGIGGEIEHAAAIIHNLRFGNEYRRAAGAESYLSFANKRGPAGCSIQIPMKHLHEIASRAHFITHEMFIPDAPGPNEVVVALGASCGGRPHARIGDREQDKRDLNLT